MKSSIQFIFEDISFTLPNRKLLKSWMIQCITSENKSIDRISIIFCSDDFLLDVNHKYLNHDYYTDIITFQYNEKNNPIQAELFISFERVKENAKKFGVSRLAELHRVIAHGLAHLLGYTDKSKKQKTTMTAKEDYFLTLFPNK